MKIMNDLFKGRKKKAIIAYLVGTVFILGFHYIMEIREYPYDAGGYWADGAGYGLNKFSLLNYKNPVRGYLFPLFTYAIQKLEFIGLGSQRKIFCVVISLMHSFFFLILIPKLIERMFKIYVPLKNRLLYLVVCVIMLRGLILYPLTDLPGIILVCSAIYFFLILMQDDINNKWIQSFYAVCMGLSLGGGILCPTGLSHCLGCTWRNNSFQCFQST